jgi:hypothetical protein
MTTNSAYHVSGTAIGKITVGDGPVQPCELNFRSPDSFLNT